MSEHPRRRRLRRRLRLAAWLTTVLVAPAVGAALAGFVVYAAADPAEREMLARVTRERGPLLVLVGAMVALATGLVVTAATRRYVDLPRRLADDIRIMTGPHPGHRARPDGPAALLDLVDAVNDLAAAHEAALHDRRPPGSATPGSATPGEATPGEATPVPVPRAPGAHGGDQVALDAADFTVVDTETTGFHPDAGDRVVAVAAVRVRAGVVDPAPCLDRLVDPRRPIPASATAVHGITDRMVAGAPPLAEVLPELSRLTADSVLVGHDIAFDLAFLGPLAPDGRVLDTMLLDEVVHPEHDGHGLDEVAARLGVIIEGRHSAAGDAVAAARILVRLVPLLQAQGIRTVGQACEAAAATSTARRGARRYPGDPGTAG